MRGAVVHMQLPAGEYTAVLKVVDSMGAAAEESVKFQSPSPPPPPPPPPAAMLPSAPASPGTPVPKLKARPVVDNDYGSSDYAPEVALPPAPVRSTTAVTETGAPAGIDG
ncbi:hypothetical protein OEZ86_001270 [Tetradesmus obliquus]|nr:hypothetical protein OEZ86_001270 [Tetradesmus obliquus]